MNLRTLTLIYAVLVPSGSFAARTGDLSLTIDGLRSTKGVVAICVWSTRDAFPDCGAGNPIVERRVAASALSEPVVFTDVPPGRLAVTVLHDENDNGRLDTNLFGIPREGIALSNNRVPKLRAPRFEDAAFDFDGTTGETLTMQYW